MPALLLATYFIDILKGIGAWALLILIVLFLIGIWNDGKTSWGGWRDP